MEEEEEEEEEDVLNLCPVDWESTRHEGSSSSSERRVGEKRG